LLIWWNPGWLAAMLEPRLVLVFYINPGWLAEQSLGVLGCAVLAWHPAVRPS
jgi:hypothetical protein